MVQAHKESGICSCPMCGGQVDSDEDFNPGDDRAPQHAPWFNDSQVISQINSGASWSSSNITYGFLQSAPYWDANYEGPGFSPFTSYQSAAARNAIALWDDLVAPTFVEKTSLEQYANIKFGNTTTFINYAHAYYPGSSLYSGEVWLNSATYTGLYSPDPGDYYFMTILHEIGHAIGLSHPGNYNGGSPTYAGDAVYAQDTHQWTVMSYFGAQNTGADWDGGGGWQYAQTPMVHDILTIQAIYGADATTRTGDTTYGFNATAGNGIYDFAQNAYPVLTVYDAGGIDTLDLSGFAQRAVVNLQPGSYSSAGGTSNTMTYNIGIAHSTWIENAYGGSGADTIYGNALDNELRGNAGNDHLYGYDGNDQLIGGDGTDWAHFTGTVASYTFSFFSSYLQVVGSFVDTVWDDVEWFSFADNNMSYSQIVSTFGDFLVESNGAHTLRQESGQYRIVAGDGSSVGLSYQGQSVGAYSYTGWGAIQAEAGASGGYDVLWQYSDGSHALWRVSESGAHTSTQFITTDSLPDLENTFDVDLNNDGQLGVDWTVESNGNTALKVSGGRYWAVAGDGAETAMSYQGQTVGPLSFPEWEAIQVEDNGTGGFDLLWQGSEGSFALWTVDASGTFESSQFLTGEAIDSYESTFRADLNQDGLTGTDWAVEMGGDQSLIVASGQYRAVAEDGSWVELSYQGQTVGPESFAGWTAIQVEGNATVGFDVLWRHTDGSHSHWTTDASGAFATGEVFASDGLAGRETTFAADLNQDGMIGDGPIVESAGDYALDVAAGQYRAVAGDGTAVGLSYQGSPTGPDTFAGWDAIQVEESGSGGFEVLWANAGGGFAWWKVDAVGAFETSQVFDSDRLTDYEAVFEADLDGNGRIQGLDPADLLLV